MMLWEGLIVWLMSVLLLTNHLLFYKVKKTFTEKKHGLINSYVVSRST